MVLRGAEDIPSCKTKYEKGVSRLIDNKTMKNKMLIISLCAISFFLIGCCVMAKVFAASPQWFAGNGLKDNQAVIDSWIIITVAPAESFDSDEEYTAEFTVKQWAENGNYKLVLLEIYFFCPLKTENLNLDEMWEYFSDDAWVPISGAKDLELIPLVTVKTYIAQMKIRIKPGFFQKTDFAEYLDYHLGLAAELLPV